MSLLAGSFSLSRYRLDQEPPPGFFSRVRDLVARFAFVDIEDSDAEASVGWVDAADPYDPGFGRLGINVGPFIVLGLRRDARTISPAVLKKYTELETRRLQAE
ncbi:MAG: DNA recombination-dependent growth factor C, partial [Proteobacteria bacterium]|nr:DNA recombination-dependent growth factor C [Pseudomonadota bacterium]